jgi:glycosyltransferase involved in cell wall biosynthesis
MARILVVTSSFPATATDPVPAFVKDQLIALHHAHPELEFSVLAPHDKRSGTKRFTHHEHYDEYRFHYFWPFSAEKLAGRGIMPALKANPINYLLIPFLFAGEFFALLRLTIKLKPALIYAHWFTPQGVNSHLVSLLTHKPFVFTTHASDVDVWQKVPLLGKHIVRSSASQARAITAVSRRSITKLQRFFTPEAWQKLQSRTQIIPMGVDIPTTQVTAGSASEKTVVFVGRLAEKKGVQYLLPAFAAAQQQLAGYRLVIAGDGPWLSKLQQQAAELNLGELVTFPGYVTGEQKAQLISTAGVYVVPSIIAGSGDAEGLPVSLMEGLAYGRVCIATNESGADDILTNGQDGFLLPQKNVDALADTLIRATKLNPAEQQAMSQRARQTAQQFAWPVIAEKHYNFLFKDIVK